MKILLINGSPKGKRSNSLKLAYSFIEGFKNGCTDDEESISIDELHVASLNIAACKGCFACWQKTPGICCIKDDMQKVIEKLIDADLILWSFPLYYFNVPGILKNLIDRQLPMNLPFMSSKQNGYGRLFIHIGPTLVRDVMEEKQELCALYGERSRHTCLFIESCEVHFMKPYGIAKK